jgi:energy-converting hydrogenase Eha subunit C
MRRHGIRIFLTFLAGGLVALLVGGIAGSLAATRYADLALFTSVLDLVRQHYFEPVEDLKRIFRRGCVGPSRAW